MMSSLQTNERVRIFASNKLLPKPRIYERLLFLAVLGGPPRLRVRDPLATLSGVVDWSVLLSAVVWGLAASWVFFHLGGYLLNKKSIPRFSALQILAFLLVFCLYLSTFVSDSPPLTFYRVSQILIAVLFGFFWLRRFGVDSTLRHLIAGYLILCVAIVISAVFAPELVYADDRLRGDAIASTGSVAALGLVAVLSYPVLKYRIAYLLIVPFLITLLALAQTRSAYIAILLFLLLFLVRLPRSKPLRAFAYLLLLLAPAALMFQWTSTLLAWVVRERETVATLNDRIPLWQYTLSETLEQSPWIGVGFYANRAITSSYNEDLGTTHSAFIEVFSGGGILSFSVFCIIVIVELILLTKLFFLRGDQPQVFVTTALFFSTIIIGITSEETVIASPTSFTFWVLLSLIPMLMRSVRVPAPRGQIGIS
jgi:hypothetical protein